MCVIEGARFDADHRLVAEVRHGPRHAAQVAGAVIDDEYAFHIRKAVYQRGVIETRTGCSGEGTRAPGRSWNVFSLRVMQKPGSSFLWQFGGIEPRTTQLNAAPAMNKTAMPATIRLSLSFLLMRPCLRSLVDLMTVQ